MRVEYSVTFQWRPGGDAIVRLHPQPAAKYGDPYLWWTLIAVREGGVAYIMGSDRPLPKDGMRAFFGALKAAGFKTRQHDRIVDGQKRTVAKGL